MQGELGQMHRLDLVTALTAEDPDDSNDQREEWEIDISGAGKLA